MLMFGPITAMFARASILSASTLFVQKFLRIYMVPLGAEVGQNLGALKPKPSSCLVPVLCAVPVNEQIQQESPELTVCVITLEIIRLTEEANRYFSNLSSALPEDVRPNLKLAVSNNLP
jgi:hypothetical protein